MKSLRSLLFMFLAATTAVACTKPGHDEHTPTTSSTPPVSPQPKPHGSHDPAHGGIVMMDAKYHVEIVLDPAAGRHRVYVSDDVRAALPASTFDEMPEPAQAEPAPQAKPAHHGKPGHRH